MGKAAHITAASKNGPRYNPTLTSEQRCSIENAIYLCSSCADIIDRNNGLDYSVKQLKSWKSEHEAWVRENLNKSVTLLVPKIQIASIRIISEECLWEQEPMNDDLSLKYHAGFHQISTFTWNKYQKEADRRVVDPIFDITLINSTGDPVLLTAVGFEALDAWSTMKGLPISGKVRRVDAYELQVSDFVIGEKSFLDFPDPIYLAPSAPYRFSLRLRNYVKVIPGNESEIRFVFEVAGQHFASLPIYMGLYGEE